MEQVSIVCFILIICGLSCSNGSPVGDFYIHRTRRAYIVFREDDGNPGDNSALTFCNGSVAQMWSIDFHDCFIGRKYADGGKDLDNIVDRILDHSADCASISRRGCRPNFEGFAIIWKKMIEQIKDYCGMYLQEIYKGRETINDLKCVEETLSFDTYKKCFKQIFQKTSDAEFQKKAENAITCTNKANEGCSVSAKQSLNKMVRMILGLPQPDVENIEEPTPEPPKEWAWYDYIIQPFVWAWKSIKSFFGW